jgi:predicted DCC family thiol-disulfide oxidoreductase YuxK
MNQGGVTAEGQDGGATRRARNTVLYDNECSLCTFQMKLLGWMDWGNRIALTPLSDPGIAGIAPSLTPEALREAIHCVTPSGRIYRGARAIRFVGMRVPPLWPLALFLWIPGVIFIAEIVYQWISRNRYLLSRVFGCKDACAILPSRNRPADAQGTRPK